MTKEEKQVIAGHLANCGVALILFILQGKSTDYIQGYREGYLECMKYITTGKSFTKKEKKNGKK